MILHMRGLSAKAALLKGDGGQLPVAAVQEILIAAVSILRATADIALHPLAVAAADLRETTAGAKRRRGVGSVQKRCCPGG